MNLKHPSKPLFSRGAGVLLHPTSLAGPDGMGDLGEGARAFVDWLAAARLGLWQVLPLVPPGAGFSPYASPSAMSGYTALIDLRGLVDEGLLAATDLPPPLPQTTVDAAAVHARKQPLLDAAADRLVADKAHPLHAGLREFARRERWVHDAVLFAALQARFQDQSRKAQAYYTVMQAVRPIAGSDDAADAWMNAPLAAFDGATCSTSEKICRMPADAPAICPIVPLWLNCRCSRCVSSVSRACVIARSNSTRSTLG